MANGHIEAPFIGNHDTGRTAGILGRKEAKVKFGYGLLTLISGSSFAYYGDSTDGNIYSALVTPGGLAQ